jgi:site-specific DNA-methyltransferase (cytosine-N4-specific)
MVVKGIAFCADADMDELARQVRADFADYDRLQRRTVTAAQRLGEHLALAKKRVGHGRWLGWLAEVGVPVQTAQRCMRLAAEGKNVNLTHLSSDLTVTAALQLIAEERRAVSGGRMIADVVAPLPANHQVFEGDCREVLPTLPAGSVQCVVTSVPYWRQRDYGHPSQIGIEPTPEEWVEGLVDVFRQVRRVCDEHAVLWLNVGDKYQASGYGWQVLGNRRDWKTRTALGMNGPTLGYKRRDLTMAPWRLAEALRSDGWYLRQVVIWAKDTAAEPVRPLRPSISHEYVFLFTVSEESRLQDPGEDWWATSVWWIPAEASDEHPATMPRELARRCIVSSTGTGDVVADPFAGIATTASVASELGRSSLSIELVPEFVQRGRAHLSEQVA